MTGFDEYDEHEFFQDSIHNINKKFAFYGSAGFVNNEWVLVYYIDSGKNYQKYKSR